MNGHKAGVLPLALEQVIVRRHPDLPPVLDGVSFVIEPGDSIAVVGANGSGKSTLARVLAHVLVPESGRMRAAGASPRVGLVLQDPAAQAVAGSVADDIAFGPESQGAAPAAIVATVGELLHHLELADLADRDPASLSGGQQQRLAIASVLACDIDLLVLDEPTSQLDPPARARLLAHLAQVMERGLAVVWITQEAADIELCRRTLALDTGAVAFDGPTELYVQDDRFAAQLGVELPPASRIAHALRAAGAWPEHTPVPVTLQQLVETYGDITQTGGPRAPGR